MITTFMTFKYIYIFDEMLEMFLNFTREVFLNFAWRLFQILSAYVMGDLIVGIFHWFKDTYFSPLTPIIGREFIWNSRLHHLKPRYVVEFSDLKLMYSSGKWAIVWMFPLMYLLNFNLFSITLFITILINDVVHKYAHMIESERPKIITLMQKYHIIQSHAEHHSHHISPYNVNYCPITSCLNVVLERINFWRNLELIVESCFGAKPKHYVDKYVEDDTYPAGIKFVSANIE